MLTRRIGWRLDTLLNAQERELIEALLIMGPEKKHTDDKVKEVEKRVRDEHRVIFGKAEHGQVTYKNYAGGEDSIPAERLLWNFFPGTIDERGGLLPTVTDVCWTANIVVLLVRVGAVRSLLVSNGSVETEVNMRPSMRTIEEALNESDYKESVKKVLEPVANELATGLMMKR